MTAYDVTMIVLVAAGAAWGAVRGFSWGLASLGSLATGYSCAHWASGSMLPVLSQVLKCEPATQRAASMLVTFGLVAGGCVFAAWKARGTLRRMKFELYDRHLGALTGGIEAALLGLIGTMFVASLAPDCRETIFSSASGRLAARVMDACGRAVPSEVREEIAPAMRLASAKGAAEATPAEDPPAEPSAATTTARFESADSSETGPAPARTASRSRADVASQPRRPADVEERAVIVESDPDPAPDPDGEADVLRIGGPTRGWAPRRR